MQILKFTTFLLIVFSMNDWAHAGNVVKTAGKKVYIMFDKSEGGTFATGDLFNITDAAGKKIGIVELKKVKGLKAIGLLRKGKASKGSGTLFRSVAKKGKKKKSLAKNTDDDSVSEYGTSSSMKMRWGAQFGYGMAKQDVVQDTATSSQSGSMLGIKLLMDYPILKSISLRGALGAEMFSVSGTGDSITEPSATDTTISTKITFASVDALLQWKFVDTGSMKFYLLGGAGILQPLSKSSDSIDPGTITSLVVGQFGGGLEINAGGFSIPIDLVYYLFPKGETVTTSVIGIKIGMYF
jgi:hypothetical protein